MGLYLKKFINSIIGLLGYKFSKLEFRKNIIAQACDLITKKNPIIFDIGSYEGETCDIFKKNFPSSTVHCFEPNKIVLEKMKEKFLCGSVVTNNFALGSKKERKKFYQYKKLDTSGFYSVNKKNRWLNTAAKRAGVKPKDFLEKEYFVNVDTVDHYTKKHNIKFIDILKIDTQGNDIEVLKGSLNKIKNNEIKVIVLEIIFSDTYNKKVSTFYEIEKILIKNHYKFYANDSFGNLREDANYQMNLLYTL